MQTLAKSMLRFSWAASLYGAERAIGLLRPATMSPGESLDALTWTAQRQLGDLLQGAYQAGGALQDEGLELAWDTLDPAAWRQGAQRLARHSLDTLRFVSPAAVGAARRRELSNKVEVFKLVRGVADELGLPPRGVPFSLPRWVEIALRQPPRRALWLIEGLSHGFVQVELLGVRQSATCRRPTADLLATAELDLLPAHTLPIIHAGLGLAVAEHLLADLRPDSAQAEFASVVERFAGLCQASALEAHLEAALEALGLVARCFFPDLLGGLDRALEQRVEGRLRQTFWHGVGRAIYFAPVSFVPGYGSLGQALAMVAEESPAGTQTAAALAGVGYAFTLVNLRTPQVLEEALLCHGEDQLAQGPFHEGLLASLVMRQQITPEDSDLAAFLDHQPADAARAALWQRAVRQPGQRALAGQLQLADRYATLAGEDR